MLAVLHSYDDTVRMLLEQAGANVRIYNQYHFTALDFVKSNVSLINLLIRSGAFVSERNSNHSKLFQWLIVNKHRRLARLFIEAGYTPGKPFLPSRIRSLKSLCRLEIRERIPGSHFRQQVASLPVENRQLIKYILLDDV
jgi:ankyrin repeat protein